MDSGQNTTVQFNPTQVSGISRPGVPMGNTISKQLPLVHQEIQILEDQITRAEQSFKDLASKLLPVLNMNEAVDKMGDEPKPPMPEVASRINTASNRVRILCNIIIEIQNRLEI